MSANPLAKKLRLKPGSRGALVNAPDEYLQELSPLPEEADLAENLQGSFDWIQLFVKNRMQLEKTLPRVVTSLKPVSILWVSFPKGSSKIQTDLTRDMGWEILEEIDLKWLTLVSVNSTWSAFAFRPRKPGEK